MKLVSRLFITLSLSQTLALSAQAALISRAYRPNRPVALVYRRHNAIDLEASEAGTSQSTQTSDSARGSSVTVGAIPVASPFAAAGGLPPEIWNAISILLKASK